MFSQLVEGDICLVVIILFDSIVKVQDCFTTTCNLVGTITYICHNLKFLFPFRRISFYFGMFNNFVATEGVGHFFNKVFIEIQPVSVEISHKTKFNLVIM